MAAEQQHAHAAAAAEHFLRAAADPTRPRLPGRIAVVVAHPDDESIGCGSLLPRFDDVTIMHVTDGAPRSLTDARARGFDTAEAYTTARRAELEAAVTLAGLSPGRLVALGWPDQEASLHLAALAGDLAHRLNGMAVVLTHTYEGGHPDHDATAFAVHAAAAQLSGDAPAIIEMPLYRLDQGKPAAQSFEPIRGSRVTTLQLSEAEQVLKRKMYGTHATQRDVLMRFSVESEQFRLAPSYDFSRLPNRGAVHYESFDWGITGAGWLELAQAAREELDLPAEF